MVLIPFPDVITRRALPFLPFTLQVIPSGVKFRPNLSFSYLSCFPFGWPVFISPFVNTCTRQRPPWGAAWCTFLFFFYGNFVLRWHFPVPHLSPPQHLWARGDPDNIMSPTTSLSPILVAEPSWVAPLHSEPLILFTMRPDRYILTSKKSPQVTIRGPPFQAQHMVPPLEILALLLNRPFWPPPFG